MPNPGNNLDLKELRKDYDINLKSRESPSEIDARIRREDAQAEHERKKDLIVLWAVVAIVGCTTFFSIVLTFLPHSSVETVKWATTSLTTILAGGVGYMTGRGSRS